MNKKQLIERFIICFILCIFSALESLGSTPYILHFNKKQYGEATSTWQIKAHLKGWITAANEKGLLFYDGYSWTKATINGSNQIRSTFIDTIKQRIYVGGVNEFGFLNITDNGKMKYNSLFKKKNSVKTEKLDNIWNIFKINEALYYIGDRKICIDSSQTRKYITAPGKITSASIIKGVLYIGTIKGLFMLSNNQFYRLHGTKFFKGFTIRAILSINQGTLICTTEGLYLYANQKIKPYLTHLSDYLKENKLFCAALSKELLAIGTIKKGVLIYNLRTKKKQIISEAQQLQNNTVLSLAWDKQRRLWAGLDRGIDCIKLNDRLTYLNTTPKSIGAGYCAAVQNKNIYLGTNRGLFYFRKRPNDYNQVYLNEVKPLNGQLWSIHKIGETLFCLHDNGVFTIKDEKIKRVGKTIGAWNMASLPNDSRHLIIALYRGLLLLEFIPHKGWKEVGMIEGAEGGYTSLVADTDSTLWLYQRREIVRVSLNKSKTKVIKEKHLPWYKSTDLNLHLSLIKNKLCIPSENGFYTYDKFLNQFVSYNEVNEIFGNKNKYLSISQKEGSIWALSKNKLSIHDSKQNETRNLYFNSPIAFTERREEMFFLNFQNILIPNEDGFSLFNVGKEKTSKSSYRKAKIRKMILSYPTDSVVYANIPFSKKASVKLSYRYNSTVFFWGVNDKDDRNVSYRFRLMGDERWEKWSHWINFETKDFSNLSEGKYTFEVYSNLDPTINSYSFIVLPPWYRTTLAYVLYSFSFLILLIIQVLWDRKRIALEREKTKKKGDLKLAEQQQIHEIEQSKKREKIKYLEHTQLKKELEHKRQEMTNLLISMAQKNEMLSLLKGELKQAMHAAKPGHMKELKQSLLIMNNQIEDNIKNEELLKRMEDEYDLLHNNFMKNLKSIHPDLNKNERLMCIYLNMELSTKEIAPLLNVSIRGAETIRYRLRKKMGIDKNSTLLEYIQSLT